MPGEVDRGSGLGARGSDNRDEQLLAEVDRELAAALSVTPSADFEARVLLRVEEDHEQGRSYYSWLAAAAALVLAAGLFYALNRAPAIEDVSPPQMVDRRPDVVLPPMPAPVVTATDRARVATAPATRPTVARRTEPEVIVPLNQMEAVRRLVRAVNEGRIVAIPAMPEGPIAPPAELAVVPLVVEPIPVPALEPDPQVPASDIRRTDY